ncbi:hypothetical protein IW145_003847 [Coemansia sp. RSA 521]|nr:hypothetical protein IW142_005487 [Coemansia sp. RSA 564]KAJ2152689.1 hypothetical protein J3F82_002503 [Coemansia sp. RSA 637]KAJ2186382.1 hypothetical protein EV181_003337 [Coemansia sp. RSA 532]KAJ2203801.1 hypothetical protein IW145_003847 [Coemansia sp. RSA 521]KAJ2272137.1 hypothetical protein GGH14_004737 [Coemansia sp. RSA 370]
MGEFVTGVSLTYRLPEEDNFSAAVFPFELIGSYVSVQEIPQYGFELERKVKREIAEFREEMEMRTIHQLYQRRTQAIRVRQTEHPKSLPAMQRASSTPVNTGSAVPAPLMPRPSAAIIHFDHELDESDDDENSSLGHSLMMDQIPPNTIKTRLPAIKRPAEPKPVGSRLKSLFRSKTRSAPKA